MIAFNQPYLSGKEIEYVQDALRLKHISGNGWYSKKCQSYFSEKFKLGKCLLTTSCTDALEMCALLLDIQPGDEVIMPSYNFVSAANAFQMRGATIRFVDSQEKNPNISIAGVQQAINSRTKAIVLVHYAGFPCDMDKLVELSREFGIALVEDAAHAIGSTYKGKPLGSFGALATFSFHETKNITSGEGGMLVINDKRYEERAEIIWEKGTNRTAFYRGEVNKYKWVDVGSSFLASELNAAFLLAQLESFDRIQNTRLNAWNSYARMVEPLVQQQKIQLLPVSEETNVAHMFAIIVHDEVTRDELIAHYRSKDILAVFHYLPLHQSPHYLKNAPKISLANCERFSQTLIRLPFYTEIDLKTQSTVIQVLFDFFEHRTVEI